MRAVSTQPILISLLLILLVGGVFWPASNGDFVNLDDPVYIIANPHIQKGITPESIHWAFTSGYASNWHPLTWLSHMADWEWYGGKPRGHHITSIVLHALNTALAFLAIRQLTGATWRSAVAAALFGLHPLRAESVAWVSERKDVLAAFFGLAAIWAYAVWAQGIYARRARVWWFYVLAMLFLGLGLLSKPMLVTLPCVLLLLDYWPLRRMRPVGDVNLWRLVAEKLPFLAMVAGSCVVTFVVQLQGGAVRSTEAFPMSLRVENALVSYVQYLGKFFYPVHLAAYYPYPDSGLPLGMVLIAAFLLLAISAVAIWLWRTQPWLVVGWFWYLGTLIPVIGLVQVGTQAMADRYTYIPTLGICIALVWTVYEVAMVRHMQRPVLTALAVVSMVACAALAHIQVGYWKDSETLARHAVMVTGPNAPARVNLAVALGKRGAYDEAFGELRTAIQIAPRSGRVYYNMGAMLDSVGRTNEALEQLLKATEVDPKLADAYLGIAKILNRTNHVQEAIAIFKQTLRVDPDKTEAHFYLGLIYFNSQQYDDARVQFQEVLRLRPDYADAYVNIGTAFFRQGKLDEARPNYEKALQLQPGNADARRNLNALLEIMASGKQH